MKEIISGPFHLYIDGVLQHFIDDYYIVDQVIIEDKIITFRSYDIVDHFYYYTNIINNQDIIYFSLMYHQYRLEKVSKFAYSIGDIYDFSNL